MISLLVMAPTCTVLNFDKICYPNETFSLMSDVSCLLHSAVVQTKRIHEYEQFCFKFIYFNWRLITLQYCSGFCHTLT